MTELSKKYQLTINTQGTGIIPCAQLIIKEKQKQITGIGLKYESEYLSHPKAIALDPIAFQLSLKPYQYRVTGNLPGFLDDYLPDTWGRKVITRAATLLHQQDFDANSVIDMLSLMGNSNIGAIAAHEEGEPPVFHNGLPIKDLIKSESAAQQIDDPQNVPSLEQLNLLHLWQEGSGGPGGARPKALIHDGNMRFLAKFNRRKDDYNNARVESACFQMAREAGLNIPRGYVKTDINGRDVLLIQRFDFAIAEQESTNAKDRQSNIRRHVISANALLKSQENFTDIGRMFKYDLLLNLLQKHSIQIQKDVEQLFRLMIFNRAINNTDDHERNFSFINDGNGLVLAPAYDLTPSPVAGAYHAAGFGYQPYPPSPNEITKGKGLFGLTKVRCNQIAEQVSNAIEQWPQIAEEAGVIEEETQMVQKVFNK